MGYSTDFEGKITIEPMLNEKEIDYLIRFSNTRHMKRMQGPYYVSDDPDGANDPTVIEQNIPSYGQPGLYCDIAPTFDGTALEWSGAEKTYDMAEWVEYLITHFLASNAIAKQTFPDQFDFLQEHTCNGTLEAQGERWDDHWLLVVENNQVRVEELPPVQPPDDGNIDQITMDIVKQIATNKPWHIYTDGGGRDWPRCFFCQQSDTHRSNCQWIRARAVMGMPTTDLQVADTNESTRE